LRGEVLSLAPLVNEKPQRLRDFIAEEFE